VGEGESELVDDILFTCSTCYLYLIGSLRTVKEEKYEIRWGLSSEYEWCEDANPIHIRTSLNYYKIGGLFELVISSEAPVIALFNTLSLTQNKEL
jgi:hypothetical protein